MTSNEVISLERQLDKVKIVLDNLSTHLSDLLDAQRESEKRLRAVEISLSKLENDISWIKKLKMPLYVSGLGSGIMGVAYAAVKFFGK